MSRLDSGLWGPLGTLPDEPPIEGEERGNLSHEQRIARALAAKSALERFGALRALWCIRCRKNEWDCQCQPVGWP